MSEPPSSGWDHSADAWIASLDEYGDFGRRFVLDAPMIERIPCQSDRRWWARGDSIAFTQLQHGPRRTSSSCPERGLTTLWSHKGRFWDTGPDPKTRPAQEADLNRSRPALVRPIGSARFVRVVETPYEAVLF